MAYSGGPDSFMTWRLLGQPTAVYLNVHTRFARYEMALIEKTQTAFPGSDFRIHRDSPVFELDNGWIPNRNLSLIIACAAVAPEVVIARVAEWGPDKNPRYLRRVERLLNSSHGGHNGTEKIRVRTPFGKLTKTELVSRYLKEFPDGAEDLKQYTRSCYSDLPKPCGRCHACWCRWVAFRNNGIDESGVYMQPPERYGVVQELSWRDLRPGLPKAMLKRHREIRRFDRPGA